LPSTFSRQHVVGRRQQQQQRRQQHQLTAATPTDSSNIRAFSRNSDDCVTRSHRGNERDKKS